MLVDSLISHVAGDTKKLQFFTSINDKNISAAAAFPKIVTYLLFLHVLK